MATLDEGVDPNTGATDWWTANQPPQLQPGQPGYDPYTDPTVAAPPGVTPPPGMHWDPIYANWVPDPPVVSPAQGPAPGPEPYGYVGPQGVPTSGFGAAPIPYVSDANAPTYQPSPTYVPPTWMGGDYVNPTADELYASPGYQARLDRRLQAGARQFAAQGTILSGGSLKALDRSAQDYAANEYQTLRNNTYDAYVQRYKQFTDAAGMDLNARTINANENQNTFANRLSTYQSGNARTLSDYLTNLTARRNNELDYWSRLQDVSGTGAGLAGGSR